MNKPEAFKLLGSSSLDDRLRAARHLEKVAIEEDVSALQQARQAETVSWIRDSLDRAMTRAMFGVARYPTISMTVEDSEVPYEDMLIRATQEVTSAIVHELEPILGLLKLSAGEEIGNYATSKTKERIERLEALARAVSNLRRASQPPSIQEFNLAEAVRTTVADNNTPNVVMAGSNQVTVSGDRGLICIALSNALRNAVEATPEQERQNAPIVVNWGRTDRDAWISVIDQGVGLGDQAEVLMKIGNSTKDEHFGMGLAIAKTAMSSLRGSITLRPALPNGARFEARWPQVRETGGSNASPLSGG
jgi:signal transduction histidine kinase